MRRIHFRLSQIAAYAAAFLLAHGCSGEGPTVVPRDPSDYPYVFEERSRDGGSTVQKYLRFADLDNDGVDERIVVSFGRSAQDNLLYADNLDGDHLFQHQFTEPRIRLISHSIFADITNDGRKEVFVVLDQGDSIGVVAADIFNKRIAGRFTPWRYAPGVEARFGEVNVDVLDVAKDGTRTLVILAIAHANEKFGYDHHGISAFDLATGSEAWRFPTVSWPTTTYLADLDGDGRPEILAATDGTGSGPPDTAGRTSAVSYLYVLDLEGGLVIPPVVLGFRSNGRVLAVKDADRRGMLDVVCLVGNRDQRMRQTRIEEISTGDGSTIRSLDLPFTLTTVDRRNVFEEGGRTKFFFSGREGQLFLVDDTLGVVRTASMNAELTGGRTENIVGDGRREFVVNLANRRVAVLDAGFNPVAMVDASSEIAVGRNRKEPSIPVIGFNERGAIILGALGRNPSYTNWITSFGLPAVIALAAFGAFAFLFYRGVFYARLLPVVSGRSEGRGMLILNRKGNVRRMDAGFRRLAGIPEKPAAGLPWADVLGRGEKLAPLKRLIAGAVAERSACEASMPVLSGDAPGEMHVSASPVAWKGIYMGMAVIAEDLTRKLKSDRAVNWTLVAQNLAHEMKTPLSTIWFSLERLRQLDDAPDAARKEELLKSVEGEIRRLDGFIKGFMKLANLNPPNLQRSSLNDAVCAALDSLAVTLPASLRIERQLEPDDPNVMLDVNLFTAAVRNILDNAVESMDGKGVLRVSTYLVRDLSSSGVCLSIADTGRGIREEDIPKVFTPYFSRSDRGTGLGLLITRKIVDEHGGGIAFTTAAGLGTEFTIRLPLAPGESGPGHA